MPLVTLVIVIFVAEESAKTTEPNGRRPSIAKEW